MTQEELKEMIKAYGVERIPQMNKLGLSLTKKTKFEDAKSCWFNVDQLVEALGCKLPEKEVKAFVEKVRQSGVNGIRFHYAMYPKGKGGDSEGSHTLVFVPTASKETKKPEKLASDESLVTFSKLSESSFNNESTGNDLEGQYQNLGKLSPPY
ncbi:MAG: hypothetical protein ACFB0B_15010 [Thermonemataceae bacterium]